MVNPIGSAVHTYDSVTAVHTLAPGAHLGDAPAHPDEGPDFSIAGREPVLSLG